MYTVTGNYFATGEGITYMVLFTRGYGSKDGPSNALDTFTKQFGEYMAQGAEVREGLHFDFNGAKLLLSDDLKAKIAEWEKTAGGLEYHACLHVNLS